MIHKELQKLENQLKDKSQKILITSHNNPDGDAVGSVLALAEYLKLKGFKVSCMVPNAFPSFLSWLTNANEIVIYNESEDISKELIANADLIFSLDYNAYHRTAQMETSLSSAKAKKVLIDHHLEPSKYFDISISKVETSSTSELIYEVIEHLGDRKFINKAIAEGLYVGIITDTGSLSYSCNYPQTYDILSHLIDLGIDGEKIHQLLYGTFSESRLRLLGYCLSDRLTVNTDLGLAYIYLTKEDLEKYNYQPGDTEGVVNYALGIEGVNFAAFFTEKEDLIRISFRSKGEVSANDFARKFYEGGGHRNAAGGNSYKTMQETLKEFITNIKLNK